MLPRILDVKILKDYLLLLVFSNGEKRVFDVNPYLHLGVFKELQKTEMFNSVKVVDGSIQWQNDADFCPDTLYLESKPFST